MKPCTLGTMGEHRQVSHKGLAMTPQHPRFVPHNLFLPCCDPGGSIPTFCPRHLLLFTAVHSVVLLMTG